MKIKRKPPGRPWQSTAGSNKICLLCLRRFQQSNDEENVDSLSLRDPLSEANTLEESASSSGEKGVGVVEQKKKTSVYLRFLHFLSRHLQVRTRRFRNAAAKNNIRPPFCDGCLHTVQTLCDVYDEWYKAQLYLRWKLSQVAGTIKFSKSRISGKLAVSLIKSLSTQLHVSSSRVVDIFRKQLSITCSAKSSSMPPKVAIHRNSCVIAMKHKLKFPLEHMQNYLKSLIAVFTLAVPPKVETKKELKATIKSKLIKVAAKVKVESGVKIKAEHGASHGEEDGGAWANDDDHGGDYSPPNSGPSSPVGDNGDDDDHDKNEEEQRGSDSDWSAKAAGGGSPNDSGSDVEFSVHPTTRRRWNLRKRRSKRNREGDDDNEDEEEFIPPLPPLRAPKGSGTRRFIDESEKKFTCNLCSSKFVLERTLRRHLGEAHSFIMQYTCQTCNLKFAKQKDFLIHKKKFHRPAGVGRRPWRKPGDQLPYMGVTTPCTECQKIFPSKMKMLLHRKTHKLMETEYTCEICGKVIKGKFRIDFHMKAHNRPDKPFGCTKCPRCFTSQDGLDAHNKLHNENPGWVPWVRKKKRKADVVPREGIYKCEIPDCGKSFYKPSNLTVHMSLHANSFTCEVCNKVLVLPRDLRRHLNKFHETENKTFFCLHCDKSFTIAQSFDLHIKTAHPSRMKLVCDEDYCTEEFDNTELLLEHLKSKHVFEGQDSKAKDASTESETKETTTEPDKTHAPTESETKNVPSESEKKVVATEHGESPVPEADANTNPDTTTQKEEESVDTKLGIYTCERCNWSFCKRLNLILHKLIHTRRNEINLYPCSQCEKAFSVVDSLQTHFNKLHGPKIKPYLCLQCGQRFHRKESFIPHLRMHRDRETKGTFECTKEECSVKVKDRMALAKHLKIHDENSHRKCDKCDEKFATKLAMLNHQHLVHGVEKPFKCTVEGCSKGFFSQYQLTDHQICHKEGTLQCPLCPRVFRRRHNLDDHILVHKQEKNHVCHYCGKAFVKKSSLSLHLAIHRGDKNYKCPHCPKAFCRKFAMDCHVRTHTKEKPFACHFCGRAFGQYTSFKNHLKVHQRLNSTEVIRRPFKKTLAGGRPLDESAKAPIGQGTSKDEDSIPTASGIIHEALQAAFDGIAMDLDDTPPVENEVPVEIKTDNEEIEEEEEEVEVVPKKRKRGRRKKSKDFICGICGKAFVREKPYKTHVEKHLTVDAIVDGDVSSQVTSNTGSHQSQFSVDGHKIESPQIPVEAAHLRNGENESNALTFVTNSGSPTFSQPISAVAASNAVTAYRRGGRRNASSASRTPPGSRLARIVEDVIEAATVNQFRSSASSTNTSPMPTPTQQQQQLHQQMSMQQGLSRPQAQHPVQSPVHQMHSGSEASTPAGSPAPNNSGAPITSSANVPFTTSSFLSPFLYANPYLLPRNQDQQMPPSDQQLQHQQTQMQNFPGFMNNAQTQSRAQHEQYSHGQGSSVYNLNQMQYPHLQQPPQTTRNTMPQDLSKSGYSIFYANPR